MNTESNPLAGDGRPFDVIRIRDVEVSCIVGINEDERLVPQTVIVNIAMFADLRAACASDNIEDTVDYKAVKDRVIRMVKESSFFLIEKLAEEIARICLEQKSVKVVRVSVDKPHALTHARSVAVEIERRQERP